MAFGKKHQFRAPDYPCCIAHCPYLHHHNIRRCAYVAVAISQGAVTAAIDDHLIAAACGFLGLDDRS